MEILASQVEYRGESAVQIVFNNISDRKTTEQALHREQDFALTMSYHSSGKVIYWYNPATGYGADYYIANSLKNITGYRILAPSSQVFNGGYRDWYVSRYNRPGFTLEIGAGYCPLPQSNFQTYWQETRYVMFDLTWMAAPK
jgi:g-D-glutamyl-meso-diaminopimelate peptidase